MNSKGRGGVYQTAVPVGASGIVVNSFLRDTNMSRDEFAREIGVSIHTVNGWAHGVRGIGKASMEKVLSRFPQFDSYVGNAQR